jgi:hypothetical protein
MELTTTNLELLFDDICIYRPDEIDFHSSRISISQNEKKWAAKLANDTSEAKFGKYEYFFNTENVLDDLTIKLKNALSIGDLIEFRHDIRKSGRYIERLSIFMVITSVGEEISLRYLKSGERKKTAQKEAIEAANNNNNNNNNNTEEKGD